MVQEPRLTPEELEQLSAFVAGDATPREAETWEARLALDPTLRREAEELRETWDLLDYLPMPEPTENFSHRTAELALRQTVETPLSWFQRLRRPAWGFAWLLAAAASLQAGYVIVRLIPDPERDLIRHLDLLERYEAYRAVEGVEFLKALHDAKTLDKIEEYDTSDR